MIFGKPVARVRQFDLVVFDWDGTLFDSTAIIVRSIQAAVADVGGTVPSDQVAAYVIGLSLMAALAHAAPDVPAEKHPELKARYQHHYQQFRHDITLFAGVLPMLEALKTRAHRLAVATGTTRLALDDALQRAALREFFDSSRTADETAGKPHPKMLHELMAEFDLPAQRMLMVGDTTHDLQLARNAGCASVAVCYGAHAPQVFQAFAPLFVAPSVPALHDWLLANA